MTFLFLLNSYIFHVLLGDEPRALSKARSQGWGPQSATGLQTGLQPVTCTSKLLTGKSSLSALPTPCRNNEHCQKGQ